MKSLVISAIGGFGFGLVASVFENFWLGFLFVFLASVAFALARGLMFKEHEHEH